MTAWELFLYRLPSEPSRPRVAVWRELRRLGALPLGQSAVAAPAAERFVEALDRIEERIAEEGGSSYRFPLGELSDELHGRLVAEWNALRTHEYAEIVEECRTKFLKEIEFELFRGNLTAGEAEEIEADLEKLRRWFAQVDERDLFGAEGRQDAQAELASCERAYEDFVERVYYEEARGGPSTELPEEMPWGEVPDGAPARIIEHPRPKPGKKARPPKRKRRSA